MDKIKVLFASFLFGMVTVNLFCQVSISVDNSPADSSAILDVKSYSKGLLIPRMTLAQRNMIAHPAQGLMIFCTENNKYYFNQGTSGSANWIMLNSQWVSVDSKIYYNTGNIGVGTTSPGQRIHLVDGNFLIEGVHETALIMKRDTTYKDGPSGDSPNPIFHIGRINKAGDKDPEFRVLYEDAITPETPVFEFDRKGIVASVKPPLSSGLSVGSHFEGFYHGAAFPYFRLNSFPKMRLEMGPGGNEDVDVAVERFAKKMLGFYTKNICQVVIDSLGRMGIGTLLPKSKLEVHGFIHSSDSGFKFPDGTVQKTAALCVPANLVSTAQKPYNYTVNYGIDVNIPQPCKEITIADLSTNPGNSGFVLISPNGKRWKITVNDDGELKATPDQ